MHNQSKNTACHEVRYTRDETGFRFQVKSLPSSEMLIGCVREWRKRNKRLLVRKGEDKDKDKDKRVSNSEV